MTAQQLLALAPILSLSLTVIVLMAQTSIRRNPRLAWWIAAVGLLITLWCAEYAGGFTQQVTPLFKVDLWGLWFSALLVFAALVSLLLARDAFPAEGHRKEEFYLLLLLATLGAVVLAQACHIASLLLGMELMGIALYAMIAFPKDGSLPLEAAIKYLVLSACASAMLLFGFALVYAATGDLSYAGIGAKVGAAYNQNPLLVMAGSAMVLAGVSFKLSLAPFHMWTPDVYQGAPTTVTSFLATLSKGAMFIALTRFVIDGQLYHFPALLNALAALAIASMLIGNWLALRQTQIKRLLAYSSTAHIGYLLVILISLPQLAEGSQLAPLGRAAVSYYLAAYIVTTLAALSVVHMIGGEDDTDLRAYNGLFWRHPVQAATLSVAMLSLAGIPLTAGFIAKFYVIVLSYDAQLWWLLGTLVVGSAIGIYYYLRVIFSMASAAQGASPAGESQLGWRNPLAILLMLMVLGLGTLPQTFIDLASQF